MYTSTNLFQYLPKRYNPSGSQLNDNREVYRFKDGNASERVISGLAAEIKRITASGPSEWIVTFIPGSTSAKTQRRYGSLASELARRTGVNVSRTAVYNAYDRESSMTTGKVSNPTESFGIRADEIRGKKVIIIDDVITRGTSFNQMGDKLTAAGASSIYGLFVAKTYNPDWHGGRYVDFDFDPDEWLEEQAAEEEAMLDALIEQQYDEPDIEELLEQQAAEEEAMFEAFEPY